MFKVKKLALVLSGALALSGCASYYKGDSLVKVVIKPVMEVQYSTGSSKIMYLLGRYHQGKISYKKAISAYKKALVEDPGYVEVHNGLGVIYSVQHSHELAVQHFKKAISLAPEATYLHNNLGYAYLIKGQEVKAAESLRLALKLDPENKLARSNLAIAFERVGLHDNAAILRLATPETKKPLINNPVVAALRSAEMVNVAGIVNDGLPVQDEAKVRLIQVMPNVYEYKSINRDPLLAMLSEKVSVLNKHIKIEVSNGNGVTGMARKVSDFFHENGFSRARLTNHQTFTQSQTTIYYQPGNREQADKINQMLPRKVNIIENNKLRIDIHVKIVLGRDISRQLAYFKKQDSVKIAVKN